MKYEEYAGREGDIVTGIVQQTDNRYTLLDLGKVEALLPQAEQVSYERYEHGARLKAYIVEVRKTTKGPQIVVSRTHPGLIKRLFELEVPEIGSGVVEIKAAAREPGHRTKIAVWSNDPNVDPVGACVGARGSRVRMVTNELRGERVDVVPFSDDPIELIQNALAPARVREVRLDEETGTATVIVSDFQLSLAIGKEGQNARLAARLTGWRIDIKSETQLAEEEAGYGDQEWAEGEWVEDERGDLVWKPAEGGEAMSAEEWSHAAEEVGGAPAAEAVQADGAAEASAEAEPVTSGAEPVASGAEPVASGAEPVASGAEPVASGYPTPSRWRRPRGPRRPRHSADTDLRRLPERPCRPTSWSASCGGRAGCCRWTATGRAAERGCAGDRSAAWTRRCAGTASSGRSPRPIDATDVEQLRAQLDAVWGNRRPDVRGWGAGLTPGPERNQGQREPLAEEDTRL